MNEKLPINTHHKEFCQSQRKDTPLLELLDPSYLVGTEEEIKLFFDTYQAIKQAVSYGNFVEVGEEPDALCNVCLKMQCKNSIVTRNKDMSSWSRRLHTQQQITDEINKTNYDLRKVQDTVRINTYTIKRAQELLKE